VEQMVALAPRSISATHSSLFGTRFVEKHRRGGKKHPEKIVRIARKGTFKTPLDGV